MSKPTILCVDDEKVVLNGLKAQLKLHLGKDYSIETVDNGDEALEIVEELAEENIELPVIISDQIMPGGIQGDELLIETHKILPNTLKILLTGQADAYAVGNAINKANLYRYISKPWDSQDLNMTVAEAVKSFYKDKQLAEQNQLLKEYNEKLEQKVEERTHQLQKAHQKITASITYAARIQTALLPMEEDMREIFPEMFISYQPRDIVSGDFYWFAQKFGKAILVVSDCTGHGVPGGFMSMIGHVILNQLVHEKEITSPDMILRFLHRGIRKALNQDTTDNTDGMDMVVCVMDKQSKTLEFSGAKNPLVYVKNGELNILKGDRMPIGGRYYGEERNYTKQIILLDAPVMAYMFSDGYQDQIGGENGRKFLIKNLKNLLFEIYQDPCDVQKEKIEKNISNWMNGKYRQLDDILVFGMRLTI